MNSMNICEEIIQLNDMERKKLIIYKVLHESNMSATKLKCFISTSLIIEHIDWNSLWHHVLTIKDESEHFSYFVSLICQKLNSILLYLFWSLCKQKQLFLSIVIWHEKICNITTLFFNNFLESVTKNH
jgi:hypothetical protein